MKNWSSFRRLFVSLAFLFSASLGVVLGTGSTASAAQLVDDDELTLDLNAYGSLLTGAEFPEGEDADYGASIGLARLKLSGEHSRYARSTVQIGESDGQMVLLDAVAEWIAFDPLFVRAGRFKTSVSQEYTISAARLNFFSRALLNSFVPGRRLGVETYGRFSTGPLELQPQVGLFQPAATSLRNPSGELVQARLLARSELGLGFHLGYVGHVFDDNARVVDGPSGPEVTRVVPYNHPLDAAVTYQRDGLDLHLEGIAVLDPPTEDSVTAGYAHAAYRFGPPDRIQFQPGLAYDIVASRDFAHRIMGGLNVYWWDTHFYNILNYSYLTVGSRETHSLFLLFHGEV